MQCLGWHGRQSAGQRAHRVAALLEQLDNPVLVLREDLCKAVRVLHQFFRRQAIRVRVPLPHHGSDSICVPRVVVHVSLSAMEDGLLQGIEDNL